MAKLHANFILLRPVDRAHNKVFHGGVIENPRLVRAASQVLRIHDTEVSTNRLPYRKPRADVFLRGGRGGFNGDRVQTERRTSTAEKATSQLPGKIVARLLAEDGADLCSLQLLSCSTCQQHRPDVSVG